MCVFEYIQSINFLPSRHPHGLYSDTVHEHGDWYCNTRIAVIHRCLYWLIAFNCFAHTCKLRPTIKKNNRLALLIHEQTSNIVSWSLLIKHLTLRSSSRPLLDVTRHQTAQGQPAFRISALNTLNSLPADIQLACSLTVFKKTPQTIKLVSSRLLSISCMIYARASVSSDFMTSTSFFVKTQLYF